MAGASAITVHLREDRRHIKDNDVINLKKNLKARINLEMAATDEMQTIAMNLCPYSCCIVPEKDKSSQQRAGWMLCKIKQGLKELIEALHSKNIVVSLFIDPDKNR